MTDTAGQAVAVALGACVGSFLNVVIWRVPKGTFFRGGRRSHCPGCGAAIPLRHNIPVVSWLLLRGKAACCAARIAWRYPLVEVLTAALFWLLAVFPPSGLPPWPPNTDGTSAFLLHACFVSLLIALTFIDIDDRLLPHVLTIPTMAVGLAGAVLLPAAYGSLGIRDIAPGGQALLFALVGMGAGAGLTWGVRLVSGWLFRQEAMGFGDVMLMAGIGAFIGWQDVLLTFFLACALGSLIGVAHRLVTGDLFICFGPFLVAGALITMFVGRTVHEFLFVTWPSWQRANPVSPFLLLGLSLVAVLLLVVIVRKGRSP